MSYYLREREFAERYPRRIECIFPNGPTSQHDTP